MPIYQDISYKEKKYIERHEAQKFGEILNGRDRDDPPASLNLLFKHQTIFIASWYVTSWLLHSGIKFPPLFLPSLFPSFLLSLSLKSFPIKHLLFHKRCKQGELKDGNNNDTDWTCTEIVLMKKNTKNWYTIDALGAILAIFTINDTFTKLLIYFHNTITLLLQYYYNTLTILLQKFYNTLQNFCNTFTILIPQNILKNCWHYRHCW